MRVVFFLFAIFSLQAKTLDVEVCAPSAVLMNAETGAVLFEKNGTAPAYPASITKVATALYALDAKGESLDKRVVVSAESVKTKRVKTKTDPAYLLEEDGTKMGLIKGEMVSLEDLLYGLMLVSGNDAANVIAESLGGSILGFVREMNLYVRSLGCERTHFQNAHGLHHPEHVTCAYDMCLIAQRALKIPQFRQIVSSLVHTRAKTNKQPAAELRQTNPLLKMGEFHYPGAIGIKTGYTAAAGFTLVAAAEREGRVLVAALLGCEKREDRYRDARRLFEAAFAEQKQSQLFFSREHRFIKQLDGGAEALRAHLPSDVVIEFYPAEEPTCKAFVHWEAIALPIAKGQRVGEVRIIDTAGRVLQKQDLFAEDKVEATLLFKLKRLFS